MVMDINAFSWNRSATAEQVQRLATTNTFTDILLLHKYMK